MDFISLLNHERFLIHVFSIGQIKQAEFTIPFINHKPNNVVIKIFLRFINFIKFLFLIILINGNIKTGKKVILLVKMKIDKK